MAVIKISSDSLSDSLKPKKQKVPFTQINNNVINHIKDSDSFLVYCYLFSKSADWKVIKQHIKKKFKFGDKKIKKIFSYLNRSNLIEYVQVSSNGSFEQVQIYVLNGDKFDKNQPFINNEPQGHLCAPALKRTSTNDALLNKDSTKYSISLNKYSRSSDDEPDRFDEWYKLYPRKQKRQKAEEVWRRDKCNKIADKIIEHTQKCITGEWKGKEKHFIPCPDTYLRGPRYKDDEVLDAPKQKTKEIKQNHNLPSADECIEDIQNGYHHKRFLHPLVYLLLEKIIKAYRGYSQYGRLSVFDAQRFVKNIYKECCNEYLENENLIINRMNYYIEHDELYRDNTNVIDFSNIVKHQSPELRN